MNTPNKLDRYRPLDDKLFNRELNALRDSYLYAQSFSSMNDPMEAFYETGGTGDWITAMLTPSAASGRTRGSGAEVRPEVSQNTGSLKAAVAFAIT